MRNKRGALLLKIGLLLLAAALFLTVYNLYDGWRAQRSAGQALQHRAGRLNVQAIVFSQAAGCMAMTPGAHALLKRHVNSED